MAQREANGSQERPTFLMSIERKNIDFECGSVRVSTFKIRGNPDYSQFLKSPGGPIMFPWGQIKKGLFATRQHGTTGTAPVHSSVVFFAPSLTIAVLV
jgi:hypothetical protein